MKASPVFEIQYSRIPARAYSALDDQLAIDVVVTSDLHHKVRTASELGRAQMIVFCEGQRDFGKTIPTTLS